MRTIAVAVREVVDNEPSLKTGLAQGLMNLSQMARYIHPAVEARTQKSVRIDAIAMALSRLRSELPQLAEAAGIRLADRITIQRGLAVMTYPKTARLQEGLVHLDQLLRPQGRYFTLTEGIREVTLIVEEGSLEAAREVLGERRPRVTPGIASLSISLSEENLTTPGILYRILQPLALQGINVAEVASTTTEFHLYIAEGDVLLALDSLYATFR